MHALMPHGDVGRIVNAFVSVHHQDAINWQRQFRQKLYVVHKKQQLPYVNQVNGIVHLITVDNIERRYEGNLVRLPDYRRILPLTHCITPEEQEIVAAGFCPRVWMPQLSLRKFIRIYTT